MSDTKPTFHTKNAFLSMVCLLALILGLSGTTPTYAAGKPLADAESAFQPLPHGSGALTQDCVPNEGMMWANGAFDPDIATQTQQKLAAIGIDASIQARSYGETDNCGTYHPHGFDFTVTLAGTDLSNPATRQQLTARLLPVLKILGGPSLGRVTLIDSHGEIFPAQANQPLPKSMRASTLPADALFKKVYVIVYDPLLGNGQTLSEYEHWSSYTDLEQQTSDFFSQASANRLNYVVADTSVVNDNWPQKTDGFSYTEDSYKAVLAGQQPPHSPDAVNYNLIVNSPRFDICGKLNRGEIDEVWIYNAPFFGFYESTLVGPGAYYFNSSPVSGPHGCNRIIPIMGPSLQRDVTGAVHNFSHRTEDTMAQVYGSWENYPKNNWDKFALVKALPPKYTYSGCGTGHYPANGTSDYNYDNPATVLSNCADFLNYPNLGNPLTVAQPVTCATWGCTELGYFAYWFGHLPAAPGCAPDHFSNSWWDYLANPAIALYPTNACQPGMHIISGKLGAAYATLSYMDGTAKTVTSDKYGNYFLMVSNGWSGRITPSKPNGHVFHPTKLDFTNLQGDLYGQDYIYSSAIAFPSVGVQDGELLESSRRSGKGGPLNATAGTLRIGDSVENQEYRSILSFKTAAGLPGTAVITAVTLKLKRFAITGHGDPLALFGGLMLDIKTGSFGSAVLQAGDFQAAASKTFGPFVPKLINGWYGIPITGASPFVNRSTGNSGLTQIRLRFRLADNNNAAANFISLFSGNNIVDYRPELIVQYYLP